MTVKRILFTFLVISLILFSCKDDDVFEDLVLIEKVKPFNKTYGGTAIDESNSIVAKTDFFTFWAAPIVSTTKMETIT